jgi:CxxC motif-containing protein (DUF1111 family)
MHAHDPRDPRSVLAGTLVALWLAGAGCGPLATEAPDPADVFDAPLAGLGPQELAAFVAGDEQFERAFSASVGLGPIFNDVSCAACHSADGRGRTDNVLVRFSRGPDPAESIGGPQLQDRALPGAEPERLPAGVQTSRRLPPPVFGMGLIEAIPAATLLGLADPSDADGDGISGRVNLVTPPAYVPAHEPGAGPGPTVGRFGRKAQVSTLFEQVVAAYHQDIGITSDALPVENRNPLAPTATEAADRVADPELPAGELRAVIHYLRLLAPPASGEPTPERRRGEVLFERIGCARCHVPVLRTGPSSTHAIADREVPLYSDLLLHDMGEALADGRPDGDADGREWRTTPLWGLRVARDFLAGELFLMHDGRARNVTEAIQLHGGEAGAARDSFRTLTAADRAALVDFVESR